MYKICENYCLRKATVYDMKQRKKKTWNSIQWFQEANKSLKNTEQDRVMIKKKKASDNIKLM